MIILLRCKRVNKQQAVIICNWPSHGVGTACGRRPRPHLDQDQGTKRSPLFMLNYKQNGLDINDKKTIIAKRNLQQKHETTTT